MLLSKRTDVQFVTEPREFKISVLSLTFLTPDDCLLSFQVLTWCQNVVWLTRLTDICRDDNLLLSYVSVGACMQT